jgi:hypothetical protein
VLTANHFIFDIIVGTAIVLTAIGVAFGLHNGYLAVRWSRRQRT